MSTVAYYKCTDVSKGRVFFVFLVEARCHCHEQQKSRTLVLRPYFLGRGTSFLHVISFYEGEVRGDSAKVTNVPASLWFGVANIFRNCVHDI